MDGQNEAQVKLTQTRENLNAAKARLSAQAESLSVNEYMVNHPYVSLGCAFFAGILLGGSREACTEIVRAAVSLAGGEILSHNKKERNAK